MRLPTALTLLAALVTIPAGATPPTWHDDAERAFAAARASGRLVLVDLYADWCGWCKVMDEQVFATPEFAAFARDYELLRVDVEDGGEGSEIQRRYGAASLPTLLLLDGKRALIGQVQGFHPTAKLLGRIRGELNKHALATSAYERTLAGSDAALWERKAFEWHRRGDGARAAALFAKLVERPEADPLKAAWQRYYLADSLRLDLRFAEASSALAGARAAARAAGAEPLGERIDWLGFAIARDARDCARAQGALDQLEKEHPSSPLVTEARRDWTSLKSVAQCS